MSFKRFTPEQFDRLNKKEKVEYLELLEEHYNRIRKRKIYSMYPETGKLSRHNYPKHIDFMNKGAKYQERAVIAANRTGKTEGMGCYELVCHMTGIYPDWWEGRRFALPPKCWAAGTTNQKTKEIIQDKLLGPLTDVGTGLLPGDLIADWKKKASSVPDVVETILVKHISGELAVCVLKSFEQGRESFEGTEQDVILLDEEPPADVYEECVIRTMTTNGIIMLTFTPLKGVSDVVQKFMPGGVPVEGEVDGRYLVTLTWDDAPHLTTAAKERLWKSLPPHQRDSRARGIPSLGEGAIYPVPEIDITVDDFPIPPYWPKAYALDVGWNNTAALWCAIDRENDIVYLYSCYKQGQVEPLIHAEAIKSRGKWVPGCADPASAGSNQKDGENLLDVYRGLGLQLVKADNSVEAGIYDVWTRMSTGRLKVFKSLSPWFNEFRMYQRAKDGKPKKENDHLMDATRYLIRTGIKVAKVMPVEEFAMKTGMGQQQGDVYDPLTHGL
ncbi:MAG: terminase family protein [Thermodesulfovibrionia bacterium]|nr:terminase family protein [Thermodesulfovibrionia bacterium]